MDYNSIDEDDIEKLRLAALMTMRNDRDVEELGKLLNIIESEFTDKFVESMQETDGLEKYDDGDVLFLGGGDDDIIELDKLLNNLEAELAGGLIKYDQEKKSLENKNSLNKTEKSTKSEMASGSIKFELDSVCLEQNGSNKLEISDESKLASEAFKFSQETKCLKHIELHEGVKTTKPCKPFPEKLKIINDIKSQLDQNKRHLEPGQITEQLINFHLNYNSFTYPYKRKRPNEHWMIRKYRKISPIQQVFPRMFQSQNKIMNNFHRKCTPSNRQEFPIFQRKNKIWYDFREKYIPVWKKKYPHQFQSQSRFMNDFRSEEIPDKNKNHLNHWI